MDTVADYDFALPEELIASRPPERRDAGRLLVLDRATGATEHRHVTDLPDLLRAGDLLVLNDTRVVPARLVGRRSETGGRWEGLYLGHDEQGWEIIGRTRGRLRDGERIVVTSPTDADADEFELELVERREGGVWRATIVDRDEDTFELLERFGSLPLPHYVDREPDESDRSRYQTVFAARPGAVAAPTAGLHFTPELLDRCRERGIRTATVTLHVGLGTFRPIAVDRLEEHVMHREWCELPVAAAEVIRETRARGGRVVAVGTTAVRTLESAQQHLDEEFPAAWAGETDLFIRPPYEFGAVDVLLTNFHLPKSTLLVLVSAFAGREAVLAAYAEAVAQRYRFFSYGDAMLLV